MLRVSRTCACVCACEYAQEVADRFAGPILLKHDRAIALYEQPARNRVLRFVTRAIMPHRRK